MISKSTTVGLSSYWTRLLILDAGTRMQRLIASSIAKLMRAFSNSLTTVQQIEDKVVPVSVRYRAVGEV
jgi:hypothetical protein